jgi:outer membrane protein insertion porin family
VAASLVLMNQVCLGGRALYGRDIRVEGLQRVEAGTIFASLPVRVGDTYSDEKARCIHQGAVRLGPVQGCPN